MHLELWRDFVELYQVGLRVARVAFVFIQTRVELGASTQGCSFAMPCHP